MAVCFNLGVVSHGELTFNTVDSLDHCFDAMQIKYCAVVSYVTLSGPISHLITDVIHINQSSRWLHPVEHMCVLLSILGTVRLDIALFVYGSAGSGNVFLRGWNKVLGTRVLIQ